MSFRLDGRVIFFATNNLNKFKEARPVLRECGISIGMLRVKSLEIQSDSLEEIAKTSALDAFRKCHLPIIVEDAGLFVEALKEFPGPYAAHAYKTIGNEGLLQLMEKTENRKARFKSAVAYCSASQKQPLCFKGEVVGEIGKDALRSIAKGGFGFDPVFRPARSKKTFAEMSITEKNRFSHRAKALLNFGEWYKGLLE
jgi:XTP/dITP diphosphohydrolase